jgi:hypothetical protein
MAQPSPAWLPEFRHDLDAETAPGLRECAQGGDAVFR